MATIEVKSMNALEALMTMYRKLDIEHLHLLESVYSKEVKFVDPAHEINGLEELTGYFASLYSDLTTIEFTFAEPLVENNSGYVQWTMTFRHRRLAGGRTVTVEGVTYVEFDGVGKIFYHRDFFDLGAMIYEQVALLGRVVKFIRKRLGT